MAAMKNKKIIKQVNKVVIDRKKIGWEGNKL